MDIQKQDHQQEPTYSSSVPIRDVALMTCPKQWTIEKGGEKESGIFVLMVRHDDDDDFHREFFSSVLVSDFFSWSSNDSDAS